MQRTDYASAAAGVTDLQVLRQQLAAAWLRLHAILDANWRTYLAVPADFYAGDLPARAERLQQTLAHFNAVARDPQYAPLAKRMEFCATHEWLARYVAASSATGAEKGAEKLSGAVVYGLATAASPTTPPPSTCDQSNQNLIVSQTREVHEEIVNFPEKLRRMGNVQVMLDTMVRQAQLGRDEALGFDPPGGGCPPYPGQDQPGS